MSCATAGYSLANSATATKPLDVSVACMSKAGKEGGKKKTNQDQCFVFETTLGDGGDGDNNPGGGQHHRHHHRHCLFGVMDGHGPHGE